MKVYNLYWHDGTDEIVVGNTFEDAIEKARLHSSRTALAHWEEIKDLPLEKQRIIINSVLIPEDGLNSLIKEALNIMPYYIQAGRKFTIYSYGKFYNFVICKVSNGLIHMESLYNN